MQNLAKRWIEAIILYVSQITPEKTLHSVSYKEVGYKVDTRGKSLAAGDIHVIGPVVPGIHAYERTIWQLNI